MGESKTVMRRKRLLESRHRRASFSEPRSSYLLAEIRLDILALNAGAKRAGCSTEVKRTLREEVAQPVVRRRNIRCVTARLLHR